MTKYIIHRGTDTWIDLDDDVVFLDGETVEGDITEENLDEIIERYARKINSVDLDGLVNPDLLVSFTPQAIIDEEGSLFQAGVPDHIIEWLRTADHDTLRRIGSTAITAEEIWTAYAEALGFAIQDAYLAATKEEDR